MVGDLSEGVVLEFLELGVHSAAAELEDYPGELLLGRGLFVPHEDSQNVQQVFRIHIELYFPQLGRGAAIEPLVIDDGGLVVLRLEDLVPEFYVGEDKVQAAEGFLVLLALVLGEGEGDIANAFLLDKFAKRPQQRLSFLELDDHQFGPFFPRGFVRDGDARVDGQDCHTVFRIDQESDLPRFHEIDQENAGLLLGAEEHLEQRGEEALDAPDALDLQLYFKAHSYIVCLILSIKREQNMHLRTAAI